ncbi:alkylhydroperoxidase AhpD family core domain-containing protein [Lentzea xinjiangensis]|uniref:Alkylhydroperoxidase AhpD family core domain-containing protein n=1 Tax=Lentzea xinjiangensis TaxID=402600 RepID=A0A1H9BBX1_9PSEU|nr:carboxymuconolactone decarboxylase family protein [Lentzea xinjiangensis]SEP86345.1 alkylhydroperoxidase AhpD family core domain-containing protein [Lentzea xinjiangensis]
MRIANPVMSVPGAMQAMLDLSRAAAATGLDESLVELICLRVSIMNGCGTCIDYHTKLLRKADVPDERVYAVAGWRDVPYYTDAEKAAFALAEEMTHVHVSDDVWNEAAKHWSEQELAGLMLAICAINTWNRLNVASQQRVSA